MDIPVDWAIPQIIGFMLVVARLSGLFVVAPVFSSSMIPGRIKIMALLVLAFTIMPVVAPDGSPVPADAVSLMVAMGLELIIGFGLGFAVSIVFAAVQVGASLIDTSVGFSMANIIDPLNNQQASVLGGFYSIIATLAFLGVNGHHWLLAGFVRSYDSVAMGSVPDMQRMMDNIFLTFTQLFGMAFQIAAPVLVSLLLVDVVLGIVSRVVPQMNVFFVGIPLKIGVGLVAIIISLPTFTNFLEHRISDVIDGAGVLTNVSKDHSATKLASDSQGGTAGASGDETRTLADAAPDSQAGEVNSTGG